MNPSLLLRSRRSGFTLVELLVVIGIIAILASVTLVGVNSAIRFAKRTKANTIATQISTAVQNYYVEYGVYPTADAAGTGTDDYYDGNDSGGNWAALIYALCGNTNPYSPTTPTAGAVPNTRNIAYLSPPRSDVDSTGRILNPFGTSAPAKYFYMVVDTDYSGIAGDTSATKPYDFSGQYASSTGKAVPGGVAVWCSCDQTTPPTATSLSSAWAHTY